MTRENHIKNLQSMIDDAEDMGLYDEDVESLQVAIKALEQEPCEDAISRKALYEALYEHFHEEDSPNNITEVRLGAVRNFVKDFPSITPMQKWIPVSERLPDKLNDVLITFYDCPNEYDVAYLRTTFNESYKKSGAKNEWVSSMGETTYADYEVDAWMPLPEPYKAESEE